MDGSDARVLRKAPYRRNSHSLGAIRLVTHFSSFVYALPAPPAFVRAGCKALDDRERDLVHPLGSIHRLGGVRQLRRRIHVSRAAGGCSGASPMKPLDILPARGVGLLLLDRGFRLRDASRKQVCFDGNFLAGQQADLGVESLIAGKSDLDAMFPGAYEHPVSHAHEFVDTSHKGVIDKDSSPLWSDMQLDLRSDFWKLGSRILEHDHLQDGFLARFDKHLLGEIGVPRLAHGDFMFTGQKQDFLVVLKLVDVAYVLPIDPNAGGLVCFGLADQLHFSQDLVLSNGCTTKHQAAEKEAEKHSVECAKRSHDQPPVGQFSESGIAWERSALGRAQVPFYSNRNSQHPGKDTVPQAKPLDSAEKSEGKADSSRRGGLGMTGRGGANCLPALRLAGVSTGGRVSYC